MLVPATPGAQRGCLSSLPKPYLFPQMTPPESWAAAGSRNKKGEQRELKLQARARESKVEFGSRWPPSP